MSSPGAKSPGALSGPHFAGGLSHPVMSGTGLRLSASVGLVASSADRGGIDLPGRESFGVEELAIALSHYDIGPIQAIQEFRRGSRRSPKLILSSLMGAFLLKRRAAGRDDMRRVTLAHGVQTYLAHHQFPVPRLIETRDPTPASMLRLGGRIYELFEFIPGTKYDSSLNATAEAGRALALFHKLLAAYRTDEKHFAASYHGATQIGDSLDQIAAGAHNTALAECCKSLRDTYTKAAARADAAGLRSWPVQVVHGDWHPGNTLFRGHRVVAVIDFDGVRPEPRALDIANGALQFSITMGGPELETWPEYLDESRFKRFCRGYDAVEDQILSTAEIQALPWLMIEALIVEAVAPIAATGQFAGFDGAAFLKMIRRKADWMVREAPRLVELVGS